MMRNCPICESTSRKNLWSTPFLVPDGWTRPPYLEWWECSICGMLYGDHPDITQADYDKYYTERYGFGVADAEARHRLSKRALYISEHERPGAVVVDFGGGDSGLIGMLGSFGFENVYNYGCGDTMPEHVDVVIAEHVLEHIYDIPAAMRTITNALKDGGMFIVDIPDAGLLAFEQPEAMPILDFNQVHINHFRMLDLLRLAGQCGFELLETSQYTERGGGIRMYVFIKGANVGRLSRRYVKSNVDEKLKALQVIGDRDVIVWGCGDIALHCLALCPLNVVYYVDIDPAFRGATIGGVPVLDKPNTNHPIVVNCQSRKNALLDYIREAGYKNEVITI